MLLLRRCKVAKPFSGRAAYRDGDAYGPAPVDQAGAANSSATVVAVAQLVESWIVIPVVVGSSPIGHPNFLDAAALPARLALQLLAVGLPAADFWASISAVKAAVKNFRPKKSSLKATAHATSRMWLLPCVCYSRSRLPCI
jgi:hypothetical protein